MGQFLKGIRICIVPATFAQLWQTSPIKPRWKRLYPGPARFVSSSLSLPVLFLIGSLSVAASSSLAASELSERKIHLSIGTSKEIEIPWKRNIQVSRRGIIFLQHISDSKWRITGLRSGLVMVNGDNQKQSSPLFIQVDPNQKSTAAKRSGASTANDRTTKDTETCCGAQNPNESERQILIRAFVTLVENSNSEISGIKARPSLEFAIGSSKPKLIWNSQLAPMLTLHSSSTLAAPIFNMFTGTTSTAHSGGEFAVQYATDKGPDATREGWKEHGFRLSITPELIADEPANAKSSEATIDLNPSGTSFSSSVPLPTSIELTYAMSLKIVQSSGATPSLSSNDLNGSMRLKKGEMAIAGVVNFSGIGSETRSALKSVPIIGPLFTDRSNDLSKKRLILWFLYEDPSNMIEELGSPPGGIETNESSDAANAVGKLTLKESD